MNATESSGQRISCMSNTVLDDHGQALQDYAEIINRFKNGVAGSNVDGSGSNATVSDHSRALED